MKKKPPEPSLEILKKFIPLMESRLIMSFYKYGPSDKNAELQKQCGSSMLDGAIKRIKKYKDTHNTEWLVDAANFILLEFGYPQFDDAHFRATDSNESPGPPSLTVREVEELNRKNKI